MRENQRMKAKVYGALSATKGKNVLEVAWELRMPKVLTQYWLDCLVSERLARICETQRGVVVL